MAITNSKLPVMPRAKMGIGMAKAAMSKSMPAKSKKGGMKAIKMGVGMGKGKGLIKRKKKGGTY